MHGFRVEWFAREYIHTYFARIRKRMNGDMRKINDTNRGKSRIFRNTFDRVRTGDDGHAANFGEIVQRLFNPHFIKCRRFRDALRVETPMIPASRE